MGIQVSDARQKLDLLEKLKESPELLFAEFAQRRKPPGWAASPFQHLWSQ